MLPAAGDSAYIWPRPGAFCAGCKLPKIKKTHTKISCVLGKVAQFTFIFRLFLRSVAVRLSCDCRPWPQPVPRSSLPFLLLLLLLLLLLPSAHKFDNKSRNLFSSVSVDAVDAARASSQELNQASFGVLSEVKEPFEPFDMGHATRSHTHIATFLPAPRCLCCY